MTPSLTSVSSPWEWPDDWLSGFDWSGNGPAADIFAVVELTAVAGVFVGLMVLMIRTRRR